MHQEIELKYRFKNREDFEKILKSFSHKRSQIKHQINYFFDTPELKLNSKNIWLRIRKVDKKFILTCKAPPENYQASLGLSVLNEWEKEIHPLQAPYRDPELDLESSFSKQDWPFQLLQDTLTPDEIQSIQLVGSFTNTRIRMPYLLDNQELMLEFDQTEFGPKRIDYEIELELPNLNLVQIAQDTLNRYFKKHQVSHETSTGKAKRLFEFLKSS